MLHSYASTETVMKTVIMRCILHHLYPTSQILFNSILTHHHSNQLEMCHFYLFNVHVVKVVLNELDSGVEVGLVELVGDVPPQRSVLSPLLYRTVEERHSVQHWLPLHHVTDIQKVLVNTWWEVCEHHMSSSLQQDARSKSTRLCKGLNIFVHIVHPLPVERLEMFDLRDLMFYTLLLLSDCLVCLFTIIISYYVWNALLM